MSKRLLIILAVIVLVLVGGYFGVNEYMAIKKHNDYEAYLHSSDKVADDLVHALVSDSPKAAEQLFSDSLRQGYSDAYWTQQFFPTFKGYSGMPVRVSKQSANSDSSKPKAYPVSANAEQYQYDFQIQGYTYRVTFVVEEQNSQWMVNELSGAYKV